MSDLEIRVRTVDMMPAEGLLLGSIPFKLDIIQRVTETIQDVGGELFGVDLSHGDIEWMYQLSEDGSRVFLDVVMDASKAL